MRIKLSDSLDGLLKTGPTIASVLSVDTTPIAGWPDGHQNFQLNALIDTGASGNCIDEQLARSLLLPIVDFVPVSGIDGAKQRPRFLAVVHLPHLNHTIFGLFTGVSLIGGRNSPPYQVLLGREFLRNFSMVYTGQTGEVIITPEVVSL